MRQNNLSPSLYTETRQYELKQGKLNQNEAKEMLLIIKKGYDKLNQCKMNPI